MEKDGRGKVLRVEELRQQNVLSVLDRYTGVVTRSMTVKRYNEMTRRLAPGEVPDGGTVEVPDFLVGEVGYRDDGTPYPPLPTGPRKVEDQDFYTVVLGTYPKQAVNQLISREWV